MVGAKAQWSYAVEEARMHDLMADEITGVLDAIAEYENGMVYNQCVKDVVAENAFQAATPGTMAYGDLLRMRRLV